EPVPDAAVAHRRAGGRAVPAGARAAAPARAALPARTVRHATDGAHGAVVHADDRDPGRADLPGLGAVHRALGRVVVRGAGRARARIGPEPRAHRARFAAHRPDAEGARH